MSRLLLASLLAASLAVPLRAQGPKDALLDAVLSFRTAKESNMTRELLEEAMGEIARQQSLAQGAPVQTEPEEPDVAVEAKRTLAKLVSAFSTRRRSAFMRYVSPAYRVDPAVLDDDLALTFRSFPIIRLTVDVDKVDVLDDVALVQIHYNLVRDSNAGAETSFSGRTRLRFRLENGKAMLIQQDDPQLFGTTLPTAEEPRAVSQGPSPETGSTGPACPTPVSGSATMVDFTEGFRFSTLSVITPGDNSDFFKAAGAQVIRSLTARMKNLGNGPLRDIHVVKPGGFSFVVPASVGDRLAIRRSDNKLAIIRIVSEGVDSFGKATMTFEYKSHTTPGVLCF